MQMLDESGLVSLVDQPNGERLVAGNFNGVTVVQTLSAQQSPGVWLFDTVNNSFVFVAIPEAEHMLLSTL